MRTIRLGPLGIDTTNDTTWAQSWIEKYSLPVEMLDKPYEHVKQDAWTYDMPIDPDRRRVVNRYIHNDPNYIKVLDNVQELFGLDARHEWILWRVS